MTVLITTDAIGGVWNYSLALADGFAAAGVDVVLAVVGPEPTQEQKKAFFSEEQKQKAFVSLSRAQYQTSLLIHAGLELDWTVESSPAINQTATTLASLAAEHRVDSVHLHAPCLATADWPVPTVATAHSCMTTWWAAVRSGPHPPEMAFHHTATQIGLAAADVTIAPSHAFAQALEDNYAIPRPLHVIHNGLQPRASAEVTSRGEFVLTAGRLWDEGKNLTTLELAASACTLPIHAAGPTHGPHGVCVEAKSLKLHGNLPNEDLRVLMAQALMFAAPSVYEPFGLAVLEAAQAETPLVLADIPTFRELWSGAALFVTPRDPQAWSATINALAANPAQRAQLGAAALARAGRYTQCTMVDATLALHTTLQSRTRQST